MDNCCRGARRAHRAEDLTSALPRILGHAESKRYVGDITRLPLADGTNLYLATVIDCHCRRPVDWAVADHMRTELVEDTLEAAAATRGTLAGAAFHSDHGSVYCSKDYAKFCKQLGVAQSVGQHDRCVAVRQPDDVAA